MQIFRIRVDHKVPKSVFVYDTGANVHVCNDELLFVPIEPPEYTTVTGWYQLKVKPCKHKLDH